MAILPQSGMAKEAIRTTVDILAHVYRRLKEQAVGQGRPKRVRFPLICSPGPKVELTNEQMYEHVSKTQTGMF
jgi:hypothetical protein